VRALDLFYRGSAIPAAGVLTMRSRLVESVEDIASRRYAPYRGFRALVKAETPTTL